MADGIMSGVKISMYDDKVRLWGLGSEFDTQSLVDMELELLKLQDLPYENQIKYAEEEIKVWQSLQAVLREFVDSAKAVKDLNISDRKINMSQAGFVNISARGSALDASYKIDVQSVATRHKLLGNDMGDPTKPLGLNGTVQLNGKDLTITSDMSLNQIANSINIGSYNMSAVIINGNLILTSKATGTAGEMKFVDSSSTSSTATSSNQSVATVELSGTPQIGASSYSLNVLSLAEKQVVTSNQIADIHTSLNATGTFILNGESFEVVETDSVQSIVDKINASATVGVVASINENNEIVIESKETGAASAFTLTDNTLQGATRLFESLGLIAQDGTFVNQVSIAKDAEYTIDDGEVLTSSTNEVEIATGVKATLNSVGASDISVNGSTDGILKALGILASDGTIKNELEAAKDAEYTIDGIQMTSSRNTITNVVDGVTIELLKPTTGSIDVSIEHDRELIKEKVKYLVDVYNNTIKGINKLTSEGAALQGESIVNRAKMIMNKELMFQNDSDVMLYELGINLDGVLKNGSIVYNAAKLDEQLEINYDGVIRFLTGEGGFADNLYDRINEIAGETGSIANKITGLRNVIRDNEDTLARRAEQFEIKKRGILQKYAYFEIMMSQLNYQMDYMNAQLEGLNSKNK